VTNTTRRFSALLEVFAPRSGGRQEGIWSGYRCEFSIGNTDARGLPTRNDAAVLFETPETIAPGEEARVMLVPAVPESWLGLEPGAEVELWEGPNLIGRARIEQVIA
jgi:hypothetical protein